MPGINLFINHFLCGDAERQKEYDFCLKTNEENPLISKIINFDNRLKYNDFFEATQDYPNDVNVLANSDIYFNETIEKLLNIRDRECYAITRSELKDGKIVAFEEMNAYNKHAIARCSQDVWVFRGAVIGVMADFHLGIPGCDNRVAHEISKVGYKVINPCYSIECIHKHESQERNYNIPEQYDERVERPYKFIEPEGHKTKHFRTNV
jgi:hypothetical protein